MREAFCHHHLQIQNVSKLIDFFVFGMIFRTEAAQAALSIKNPLPKPEEDDDSEYDSEDEDDDEDICDVLGDIDDLLNEAEQAMEEEQTPEKIPQKMAQTAAVPEQKKTQVSISHFFFKFFIFFTNSIFLMLTLTSQHLTFFLQIFYIFY